MSNAAGLRLLQVAHATAPPVAAEVAHAAPPPVAPAQAVPLPHARGAGLPLSPHSLEDGSPVYFSLHVGSAASLLSPGADTFFMFLTRDL